MDTEIRRARSAGRQGRRPETDSEVLLCTRVGRSLHAKIVARQREMKESTGIEPSTSALIRAALERDFASKPRRVRRAAA